MLHSLQALSKLSRREWNLFPHKFQFMTFDEAMAKIPQKEPARYCGDLTFTGETPLSIMCIFSQESAINLTHYITDKEPKKVAELTSLQTLTVAEVSNILTNTFLNVFANTIGIKILPKAPRVLIGSRAVLLKEAAARAEISADLVLTSEMRLESEHMSMCGEMVIIFSAKSFKDLIAKVKISPAWDERTWRIF